MQILQAGMGVILGGGSVATILPTVAAMKKAPGESAGALFNYRIW